MADNRFRLLIRKVSRRVTAVAVAAIVVLLVQHKNVALAQEITTPSPVIFLERKTAVRGDIPRSVIASGKRATAFVETKEGTGSAFCIDTAGYFVTNQHVVGSNEQVTLILNCGESDQKTVIATVVERDTIRDLVLLKAEGSGPWKALPLAPNSAALFETIPVAAFGFPYGKDLAPKKGQYPSITVNAGRITSLHKEQGLLVGIQTDASSTPGDSGGPLLDDQGKVVGIVQKGIKGERINFAIPIEYLQAILLRPHITVLSGAIPQAKIHSANVVRFQIAPWTGRHEKYDVTFTRDPHTGQARGLPVQSGGDNIYVVTTVPFPQHAPPANLRIAVVGAEGSFVGTIKDGEIRVGTQKVPLRDVSSIEVRPPPSVRLRSGRVLTGVLGGISELPVVLNGVPAKMDLSQAHSIAIGEWPMLSSSVRYELVVRQEGKIIVTMSGRLEIEKDPRFPSAEEAQITLADAQAPGQTKGPLSFRAPHVVTLPGMKEFTGLKLADVDNDGHLDILVTVGANLVVLYGHGDGETFDLFRYPMGEKGSHLCIADLNHDGRADVVISGGGGVQVLLGTGARRFATPQSYPTGEAACCVTVGDFNNDGNPDLAVGNIGSSNLAVLLNRGDGTFGTATVYSTPQYPMSLAAADLNGDGNIDIAVNCFYSQGTLLYLSDGHGVFRKGGVRPETGGGQLLTVDFNRDGRPDLAGVNYWSGGLSIALGDRNGNFVGRRIGTLQYPSQIDVGDIDGDGRPDLIFGNQGTHMFTVCLNPGTGPMQEGLTFSVTDGDVHSAVIGDLNQDGQADIVADGGADHLFLFLNNAHTVPAQKKPLIHDHP